MVVDLKNLRNFVAVASAGSISRAAENIHIAQPALSKQIQQIEDYFGTDLFVRTHRGVKLTPAGERLVNHAKGLLKRFDIALEDVREAISEPSGRVALGLPQSMAKYLAVPLVRTIVQRWPNLKLQIVEMNTGYVTEHLTKGDIDLGMTFGTTEGDGVIYSKLLEEELVFISSSSQISEWMKKNNKKNIQFKDLNNFSMVLPTKAHSLRQRIDEYLHGEKIELNVIAEVNAVPQLIELAEAGVGSTILSYAAVYHPLASKKIRTFKIINPTITRSVYLCRNATIPLSIATLAIQQLIESLVKTMVMNRIWPTTVQD